MARPFFALISFCLLFGACTQRTICPAFQSAYIYDKEALRKKFSYFLEDSTPKILTASSKNRYLVAEPVSYRKKLRSMNTVAMKDVNPVLPDSMKISEEGLVGEDGANGEDGVVPGAELDMAARSVIDSTYIVDVPQESDTTEAEEVYMISKDKEVRMLKYNTPDSAKLDEATGKYVAEAPKYTVADIRFNVEQDNYMWYLRKSLVLPDVKLAAHMQQQQNAEAKKEKKGIKGFFRNLFKRKKKDAPDSLEIAPKPKEEFDYVDENEADAPATATEQKAPEKKGMFGFKKKKKEAESDKDIPATSGGRTDDTRKKKKEKKPKETKPKDEAAPKEKEEDDGF